jgi:hypothetical protein
LSDEPNIEVILTDPTEPHCFKLVFQVRVSPESEERRPLEIFLHTTQALDLHAKLGAQLSEYFHRASSELLEIRSRTLVP